MKNFACHKKFVSKKNFDYMEAFFFTKKKPFVFTKNAGFYRTLYLWSFDLKMLQICWF